MIDPLTPTEVQGMLADGQELAILDLREEVIFSRGHLFWARSVPLSRLEISLPALVPRLGTRIVLCDDGDGVSQRAAGVLRQSGYTHLWFLNGGVGAWAQAGLELFSGINVPSKGFGEFIEHTAGTPSIAAGELDELLRAGADVVVVDSRPFDEYVRMSIPTAINVPGAELVLRIRDVAPSPRTMVVVNCAGRTRSIIGAQSLIDAGIPNQVAALRNGTMGWVLAGLALEGGQNRRATTTSNDGLNWAKDAARRVAHSLGIERIDAATLKTWQSECHARTLYVFDVRDPNEYRAGHIEGAISAPGGQLVQATDQYVGTLGARIVLVDDREVRALMTASWLRRMGWQDVVVLVQVGTQTVSPPTPILAVQAGPDVQIDAAELAELLTGDAATVIDLSRSSHYRRGHIPGAWFAIRARLARALPAIRLRDIIVLTSEDGVVAGLAVSELSQLTQHHAVRCLAGGNAAWLAAGFALTPDQSLMADEAVDVWLRPYEQHGAAEKAMAEYLVWETALLPRIQRDGASRCWR
jgi:rhodanese-related sulfurtransferase